MKKIATLLFAIGLIVSVNSCKKCNNCELQCRNAVYPSGSTDSYCRSNYSSDAEFTAAVANAQAGGAVITTVNEKEKVCTGGLFYRIRQNDAVSAKESSGWSCD
jgi:hypothetical protein